MRACHVTNDVSKLLKQELLKTEIVIELHPRTTEAPIAHFFHCQIGLPTVSVHRIIKKGANLVLRKTQTSHRNLSDLVAHNIEFHG